MRAWSASALPRFGPPVQFTKPRFVGRDIELGGVRLRKGDRIMAMLAAANFDPDANPHPERLDLARRPNRHLAFGTGIHFCLGHQLARIEARCALEALFKRWPGLELAVPPDTIRWRPRPGLRALERLPVTTSPRYPSPSGIGSDGDPRAHFDGLVLRDAELVRDIARRPCHRNEDVVLPERQSRLG